MVASFGADNLAMRPVRAGSLMKQRKNSNPSRMENARHVEKRLNSVSRENRRGQ